MTREKFFKKIQKLETEWEDYCYSQCETVSEKCNFKNEHNTLLDTTRVFFFGKTNTVVLYDRPNGFKNKYKNPTLAIKEIESWMDTLIRDQEYYEQQQAEEQALEEIYYLGQQAS